jgi:hypothetical protein
VQAWLPLERGPTTPPPPGVGILTYPGPKFYPLQYKRSQKFSGPPGGGSALSPKKLEKLCLGIPAPPPGVDLPLKRIPIPPLSIRQGPCRRASGAPPTRRGRRGGCGAASPPNSARRVRPPGSSGTCCARCTRWKRNPSIGSGGGHYGKIIDYGLLRILRTIITEITVLIQRNFITLKRLRQTRPKTPTFVEIRPKLGTFYFGFFITEYYGP